MVHHVACGHLIEQLLCAGDFCLLNWTQLKTFHCAFRFGYARLYLEGNLQMWVDAEDSLEL